MVLTHYKDPLRKVTITHGGSTYQLEDVANTLEIVQRENKAWSAELLLTDEFGDVYDNKASLEDIVAIYSNYSEVEDPLTASSLRFYGFVDCLAPRLGAAGAYTSMVLRAYDRCLLQLLCGQQYGTGSRNPTLDTVSEILTDASNGLIIKWVNKLLGSADASGYSLDTSLIEAVAGTIPFLDYPYKPAKDCLDDLLDLYSAVVGDAVAGCHWIVKPEQAVAFGAVTNYFLLATVGNHPAAPLNIAAKWPTWWNTDLAGSTITVTEDMIVNQFTRMPTEANYILYSGLVRKPGDGDYLTNINGGSALWTSCVAPNTCAISDSVAQKIVGTHSLLLEPNNSPNIGGAFYPAGRAWNLDFVKCSTPTSIPHLVFYVRSNNATALGQAAVYLATDSTICGDGVSNYFWMQPSEFFTSRADKWFKIDIPIGPYYALDPSLQKDDGSDEFEWNDVGTPLWSDIDIIVLLASNQNAYDVFWDGLHFEANVTRAAKKLKADSSPEDHYKLRLITDDVGKDDSLLASDDSGTLARLTHAELLRDSRTPITGAIKIPAKPTILPGQLAHIHAVKTATGTYRVDKTMRIPEHKLGLGKEYYSILALTDDLKNSRPMAPTTEYSTYQKAAEIAFQNRQNSSIKAGAIDTLRTVLEKTYAFSSTY